MPGMRTRRSTLWTVASSTATCCVWRDRPSRSATTTRTTTAMATAIEMATADGMIATAAATGGTMIDDMTTGAATTTGAAMSATAAIATDAHTRGSGEEPPTTSGEAPTIGLVALTAVLTVALTVALMALVATVGAMAHRPAATTAAILAVPRRRLVLGTDPADRRDGDGDARGTADGTWGAEEAGIVTRTVGGEGAETKGGGVRHPRGGARTTAARTCRTTGEETGRVGTVVRAVRAARGGWGGTSNGEMGADQVARGRAHAAARGRGQGETVDGVAIRRVQARSQHRGTKRWTRRVNTLRASLYACMVSIVHAVRCLLGRSAGLRRGRCDVISSEACWSAALVRAVQMCVPCWLRVCLYACVCVPRILLYFYVKACGFMTKACQRGQGRHHAAASIRIVCVAAYLFHRT